MKHLKLDLTQNKLTLHYLSHFTQDLFVYITLGYYKIFSTYNKINKKKLLLT